MYTIPFMDTREKELKARVSELDELIKQHLEPGDPELLDLEVERYSIVARLALYGDRGMLSSSVINSSSALMKTVIDIEETLYQHAYVNKEEMIYVPRDDIHSDMSDPNVAKRFFNLTAISIENECNILVVEISKHINQVIDNCVNNLDTSDMSEGDICCVKDVMRNIMVHGLSDTSHDNDSNESEYLAGEKMLAQMLEPTPMSPWALLVPVVILTILQIVLRCFR